MSENPGIHEVLLTDLAAVSAKVDALPAQIAALQDTCNKILEIVEKKV